MFNYTNEKKSYNPVSFINIVVKILIKITVNKIKHYMKRRVCHNEIGSIPRGNTVSCSEQDSLQNWTARAEIPAPSWSTV